MSIPAANVASSSSAKPKLGIIAGGGRLPRQLIEACQATGRSFFILGFEGQTDRETYHGLPHAIVKIEAVGEALSHLRKAQARELVLVGKIRRPSLMGLRLDIAAAKLFARMGTSLFAGDDALLKSVVSFLEEEGFHIIGAEAVLASLIAPEGVLGKIKPDKHSLADIARAMTVVKAMGDLDIGQAVVVENGYVLGVEAAEGTDGLIERCAELRTAPRGGVLLKAKKPSQETRVDLPAIGPTTVQNVHAAGLLGIAVEAGGSLILDREQVIQTADELGIFVVGVHHE